jgi:hypothetical protein
VRWFARQLFTGPDTMIAGLLVDFGAVPEPHRRETLQKLADALAIIGRADPKRLRRLVAGGTRMVLSTDVAGYRYFRTSNFIVLGVQSITSSTIQAIAVSIVHEATHARIDALMDTPGRLTARVERRCIEEEIAFVRRWPQRDEEGFRAWEAAMRAQLETPWWTVGAVTRGLAREVFAHVATVVRARARKDSV